MDDVALEHRLTAIESTVTAATAAAGERLAMGMQAAEARQASIVSTLGEIKAKVDQTNGTVISHENRLQLVERWTGSPVNPQQAAVVLGEHAELMIDYRHRQTAKDEGHWFWPVLISVMSLALAAGGFGFLVIHG